MNNEKADKGNDQPRNRKRGGRGRGLGRGRGERRQQDKGGAEDASRPAELSPAGDGRSLSAPPLHDNVEQAATWFRETLTNLGHFDPSSASRAILVGQHNQEEADAQLVNIFLYLEDRIIRAWDLDQRTELRTDFWFNVDRYLEALECPKGYLLGNNQQSLGPSVADSWRNDAMLRPRVVYWVLACATAEAFGDQFSEQRSALSTTEMIAPEPPQGSAEAEGIIASKTDLKDYPLGFSTGDKEVDHVLTFVRMKLLLHLEQEQRNINKSIAELQRFTVQHAKPLTDTKTRKPNADPPAKRKNNNRNNRR